MFSIAERLYPQPAPFWSVVKQIGVDHAVGMLEHGELGSRVMPERTDQVDGRIGVSVAPSEDGAWSWEYEPMRRLRDRYAAAGLTLAAIEDFPPMDRIRLGLDGRDEEIEWFSTQIRSMGALGIPVLGYSFMAVFGWHRTSTSVPGRGGALMTGYDHALMRSAPLTEAGTVTEERMWDNLEYFLRRVVPVAEEAGVRLALHPDDPPVSPIRGLARIMRSVEAYERMIELVPSPANAILFCQGNFGLMTDDLPAAIRHFGDNIAFVHFRDALGCPDRFVETFHDNGPTDMLECMHAYREIGFEGAMRPDHVPTLTGDSNAVPGYADYGKLFALGYMTGLRESVFHSELRDREP